MILIQESKRDELIVPYLKAMEARGIEKPFGVFKSEMLEKLSLQGGMHNLSKSSNYYLAGAVRYYFEGKLTVDGKASYFESGDVKAPDNWNIPVCQQLDAIIELLRNAYIDTVGETFEQPEDFGTLPLEKLLKKYGKKAEKDKKPEDTRVLDRNTSVGNGYTFDILKNYESATKYSRWTSPGAWCITYGQGHYNGYIKRLDIHYVIFLQNGYQSVERKIGPGFTPQKPHDEYGNSMIAVLQSNHSWEPVYITSRWNHGYERPCEADHAYTTEEFCQITGVSVDDLKRIFEIWKTDYKGGAKRTDKKETISALRRAKYVQMLINGGSSIDNALKLVGGYYTVLRGNNENLNKSIMVCDVPEGDAKFRFLIDKRKVVFDSFTEGGEYYSASLSEAQQNTAYGEAIIITLPSTISMIYNTRFHEMVNVDGVFKFKKVAYFSNESFPLSFFEVAIGKKDKALISTKTLKPLRLPNSEFWYNDATCPGSRRWERQNQTNVHFFPDSACVIKIVFDESSRETYWYNIFAGKFFVPEINGAPLNVVMNEYVNDHFFLCRTTDHVWNSAPLYVLNRKGEQSFFYGYGGIEGKTRSDGDVNPFINIQYGSNNFCAYDVIHKKIIGIDKTPITCNFLADEGHGYYRLFTKTAYYGYNGKIMLYNSKTGRIVRNPNNYPNENTFDNIDIVTLGPQREDFLKTYGKLPDIFPDESYPDDTLILSCNIKPYNVYDEAYSRHVEWQTAWRRYVLEAKGYYVLSELDEFENNIIENDETLPTEHAKEFFGNEFYSIDDIKKALDEYAAYTRPQPQYSAQALSENRIYNIVDDVIKKLLKE